MLRTVLCFLLCAGAAAFALEEKELREGDRADGSFIITYCLGMPAKLEPERQYPLIICFHGRGGKATHHADTVLNILKSMGLQNEAIILGAKSQGDGWDEVDHIPVTKLLTWALKTLPVDPRRVYTHGMSSGGSMSGTYALTHPELIAAGVVYASGINTGKIPTPPDPAATHPDLYIIMGQKDDDGHKSSGVSTTRWLTANKFQHIYRHPEDLDHSPNHPVTNRDSTEWLLRQRHKTIAPPADDITQLRGMLKSDTLDAAGIADLARIGGPPGAAVAAKLLSKRDPPMLAAVLTAAMNTCFGTEVHLEIGKRLLKSPDAALRSAAIAVFAQDARWRYPVAMQALEQIVFETKRDLSEREAAATGLATAASFQIRGNYQDPEIFIALVKLLDVDEESLRTIAFDALKSGHESPYDPKADKGGRSAGLRSFQQWAKDLKPLHAP